MKFNFIKSEGIILSFIVFLSLVMTSLCSITHAAENEKEVLYWVAPMDSNYRRDKPGKITYGYGIDSLLCRRK